MLPRLLHRSQQWSQQLLARLPAAVPSSCALCGRTGPAALCDGCHAQFFAQQQPPRCRCCALPLSAGGAAQTCGACLRDPPAFDATIVAADYAAPVDQLALSLKFGGRLALAPLCARLLHAAAQHFPPHALPARIVAVPLGAQRLAGRGFNQALEIARPLSHALGVALDARLVVRLHDTRAQALLHPDERHRNVRHAFAVPGGAIDRVRGQHIGVVDDVMTTGATLNEIAALLKRYGAARVTNFVFARTSLK